MTTRKVSTILIALVVASAIGYFGWRQLEPTTSAKARIVVVLPSDRNPFWIEVRRGAEKAATEISEAATVNIAASNDQDATSQKTILNNYYTRKAADALVLGPADDHATVENVAGFLRDGISVIVIDTQLDAQRLREEGVQPTAFIGSSNRDGGEKAARAMHAALRKKGFEPNVLLIQGSFVHQSAIDRTEGFREIAEGLGLNVVEVKGEWKKDLAQELTATHLSRDDPVIGGIFANNDDMALGAVSAIKAMGNKYNLQNWPIVIGFDATNQALSAISAGEMYATVQQDATLMGYEGVMSARRALSNDPSLLKTRFLDVKIVPEAAMAGSVE